MVQNIMLEPVDAEVRAGSPDSRIDLGKLRFRKGSLEVSKRFRSPAGLLGDRAAQVGDFHLGAGRSSPGKEVRQPSARTAFLRGNKGKLRILGSRSDGNKTQGCQHNMVHQVLLIFVKRHGTLTPSWKSSDPSIISTSLSE